MEPPSANLTGDGRLELRGNWRAPRLPPADEVTMPAAGATILEVDTAQISAWDSRLLAYLLRLQRRAEACGCSLRLRGHADSVQALHALATTVPYHEAPADAAAGWLSPRRWRRALADIGDDLLDSLAFLGETLSALAATLVGRGAMRSRDLLDCCYRAGPDALGIITLTSVLVGMILAYLGAEQLRQFGAAIYVADLVAIGMLREMGALMTAVVMSGRTGAAYAAELSSMQGNEEIDAIRTLGIPPVQFLVVPRVLALCLTMPLLVVFADALGIIGGGIVAGGMGVTPLQYIGQLQGAISPTHFLIGIAKGLLFAVLIAIAGCRAGMQAGRSSEAVGKATTDAVVTAVVYLIIADAAANILCQQLGI
jgi:phospholipid/cholesterol/gamma-HCH transport system permease protein